jgi:CRP/FNR family transcriptional regulator, anaerobic regulatory protein
MQVSTAVSVREECRPHPALAARPLLRDVSRDVASCTVCTLQRICMPVDIQNAEARALFERLVTTRIRLHKGDVLFRAGDRFTALFAVRVGSLKTVTLTDDGTEQVSGYHLSGEIVGMEGVGNDVHACQAVALEDTEVCTLPFDRVEQLARDDASFQRRLYRLLSSAIVRERAVTLVVGTMRAEQRLASFLVDLSNRYHARGYSSTEFVLRMTRAEIGSHLGLKLETVSRLFSRFAEERLLVVSGRVLKLLDRAALQRLVAAG